MSDNLQLGPLGQVARAVADITRAEAWYRDVLGLTHLYTYGKLAFFDCGGVRLMLGTAEKPEYDHPGSVLYYKVSDINASYEALKKRGVAFIDQPHLIAQLADHDLWMVFLRDSEGNTLALMSEVAR